MKLISFVIPVYRNQGSLRPTYLQLIQLFQDRFKYFDYEIIFVDDGSDDNSYSELIELHGCDKKVKVISFSRNFGQLAALAAGLRHTKGNCAIIMSADLQDPICLVEDMLEEWLRENEIVIGYRLGREDGLFDKISSNIFYSLMKFLYPQMPRGGFDFVLLDKICIDEFNKIEDKNRFFQGDILSLGFEVKFIPYKRLKRTFGKSQWTMAKKSKYFIDSLITSSYLPIRLMSVTGFITTFIGFFYGLLIVHARIIHSTPFTGWAPIMILILIIGGLTISMLGIIGEYVWRIYDEVRKRQYYIIKSKMF